MDARCPLCSSLFQTDRTGIQPCPRCGQTVNVAEAPVAVAPPEVTRPSLPQGSGPGPNFEPPPGPYSMSPPAPEPVVGGGVPWERRNEVGWVKGWWDTWVQVVTAPGRFFGGAGPTRSMWDAVLFAWIATALGSIPDTGLRLVMGLTSNSRDLVGRLMDHPAMDENMRKVLELMASGDNPLFVLGSAVAGVVVFPVGFFISAGMFHVSALVCGAGKGGFETTVRALGYAWAPLVLAVVPCLPVLYWPVLLGIGLVHLRQSTPGRATATVMLPSVVFTCCLCGFSLLAATWVGSMLNGQ